MALCTSIMSKAVLPGIRMSNRTDRVHVESVCVIPPIFFATFAKPRSGLRWVGSVCLLRGQTWTLRAAWAGPPRFREMVRFLRRRGHGQGKALTLVGVAETFVALNRGPRVQAMEI